MKIKPEIQDAINDQVQAEMYSANLYLSMSCYFESINLSGFANWMRVQWKEETAHAVKFINYLEERGGRAIIKKIDQPPSEFGTVLEVFQKVLEHEQYVTDRIHKLYELSLAENDYPLQSFLKWYIDEQVEEEANASEILESVKMLGDSGYHIYMLDSRMKSREFDPAEYE